MTLINQGIVLSKQSAETSIEGWNRFCHARRDSFDERIDMKLRASTNNLYHSRRDKVKARKTMIEEAKKRMCRKRDKPVVKISQL